MATETKSTTVRLKPITQDGSSKPKIDSLALKKKIDGSTRPPTDSRLKSVTTVTKSEVKLKPAPSPSPSSSSKPALSSISKLTPPSSSSKPALSSSSKPALSSSCKPAPSSSSKPTPPSSSSKPTPPSSSLSKTITKKTTTTTKVREKKVYSLPGQKHDPPEQKEPLRIFYESLSKQIPTSEMAEFWLMEHGLLSPERAKRAFEKKQRKQKELRTGTPVKPSKTPPSRPPPTKPETSRKPQQPSRNGDTKAKKRIVDDSDDDDDDFVLSHKRWKSS